MREEPEAERKRRLFPRYKLPVYYRQIRSIGQKQQIQDIGLGGMRSYSNKPLKVGRKLEIRLFLPKGKTAEIIARVAWINSLPPGSEAVYDVGFEFIDLPPEIRQELKSLFEGTSPEE